VRIGSFEFNVRELAGSMGDFGTLLPLAIGYITVCKMDPCGLLVMMGLANIVTGLVYRLPMPIEPMKVLAVMAIAQAWPSSSWLCYARTVMRPPRSFRRRHHGVQVAGLAAHYLLVGKPGKVRR